MAREIGAPAAWAVVLKLLAYLSLGWILVRMPTVHDFFADKRGEVKSHEHAAPVAAVAQEPAIPVAFTAEQNEGVRGLAQYIRFAVWAL